MAGPVRTYGGKRGKPRYRVNKTKPKPSNLILSSTRREESAR